MKELKSLLKLIDDKTKPGLYRTMDDLINYWRKKCELGNVSADYKEAGLRLIDNACAKRLQEIQNEANFPFS